MADTMAGEIGIPLAAEIVEYLDMLETCGLRPPKKGKTDAQQPRGNAAH